MTIPIREIQEAAALVTIRIREIQEEVALMTIPIRETAVPEVVAAASPEVAGI
jgi:hypothetical protein